MQQQVDAMQRRWPQFDVVYANPLAAMWCGSLVGIERTYRVSVEFGMPTNEVDAPLTTKFPVVRVLSPQLILRPNALEEAPLPHVYFEYPDLTLSPLCLFDPAMSEWSHNDLIAKTTIPWAADWLACYEGWLATGKWFGGGRHGTATIEERPT
jgi:hypothetical protein